jgi:hypothetical protein
MPLQQFVYRQMMYLVGPFSATAYEGKVMR